MLNAWLVREDLPVHDLIQMVNERKLTPAEAVSIMMYERELRLPLWFVCLRWFWWFISRWATIRRNRAPTVEKR